MSDQDGAAEREERAIIAAELSRVASLRIDEARGMTDALSLDEELPVNRGLRYRPKRFRVNVGSATAVLEGSAEDIEGLVRAALDAEGGRAIRSRPGLIVAVVMSGVGKMNPAVVSARMDVATRMRTVTVTLRGVAAEGLIKTFR